MDKAKGNKNEWVRCASKSHRGRFYLFNKTTGETQWESSKRDDETTQRNKKPASNLPINKVCKTPAQDRLKRLQHSLKSCQTSPRISNTKPKNSTEQKNDPADGPSTSCFSKSVASSTKKDAKQSESDSFARGEGDLVKCVRHSAEENDNRLPHPDSPSVNSKNTNITGPSAVAVSKESSSLKVENNENLQNVEANSLTNICSGIVKKIKEICKRPFSASRKIFEKPHYKTADHFGLTNTSTFKTTSKTKSKQILSASVTHDSIVNHIQEESKKAPEHQIFNCSLSKSTPKNQNIPAYPRGSANSRLERLKQSLLIQQQLSSTKCSPDISDATETNTSPSLLFQKHKQVDSSESTTSVHKTNNNEVEGMDWQPITIEGSQSASTTVLPTLVVEKSKKCLLKAVDGDENQTIGDIIDTINENLLRFSAEKQKATKKNKKWRKDFYYFVLDTNVLLKDLTFIEDLTKMKLCDTKGSLLYVPYSVLQELDRLKMRSGCQEGVKTLAVRAIKYLNSKFENNSAHLQAQSALEERLHLIDVKSADDSIINCCLQAKDNIPNVLLLTEDVNLRNKAISNNILVSTKSDLLAKRYSSHNIS